MTCGDIKQISSSSLFEPVLPAWLRGKAQAAGAAPVWPRKHNFGVLQVLKPIHPSIPDQVMGTFWQL